MSTCYPAPELRHLIEEYLRAMVSTSSRSQAAYVQEWKSGLERLRYAEVKQTTIDGSLRALITIRLQVNNHLFPMQVIKPDIERIWNEEVARQDVAAHAFVDTDSGFDFLFAAKETEQAYITGKLVVFRKT